jgi:hypothetical protein
MCPQLIAAKFQDVTPKMALSVDDDEAKRAHASTRPFAFASVAYSESVLSALK